MGYPVKYTLQVRRGVESVNADGDPTYRLGEPEPIRVVGWWLSSGQENGADGHIHQVDYDASMFLPSSENIQPEDEIMIPRVGWCRVDGPVANWDNGPWWSTGLDKITLRRVSNEDRA